MSFYRIHVSQIPAKFPGALEWWDSQCSDLADVMFFVETLRPSSNRIWAPTGKSLHRRRLMVYSPGGCVPRATWDPSGQVWVRYSRHFETYDLRQASMPANFGLPYATAQRYLDANASAFARFQLDELFNVRDNPPGRVFPVTTNPPYRYPRWLGERIDQQTPEQFERDLEMTLRKIRRSGRRDV